jgi:hypothetical protein
LQAAREGKRGVDCRGEEHEIQLVWSILSGKIRVFWNKSDITHLFRESRQERRERVDISWEARSGANFRILARDVAESSSETIKSGHGQQQQHQASKPSCHQYDLLVDGQSVFTFPHISQLVFPAMEIVGMPPRDLEGSEHKCEERSDDVSSIDYDLPDSYHHNEAIGVGLRLSMAGFTPAEHPEELLMDDLTDDLTSTSLNNALESLRGRIIEMIPFSDGMVSKALVHALSEETSDSCHSVRSWDSCSSSFGSGPSSIAMQFEADVLKDTVDWINHNVQYAPRPDVEDQKRDFLQRQMDIVFVHVRQERVSVEGAARVLCDVATLLGMTLTTDVRKDTLMLKDLDKGINTETLIDSLCPYGDLKEVGIASGQRFGK